MKEEHLQQQIKGFLNTPPIWLNTQFEIEQFNFPQVDLNNFCPTLIPQKMRLGHQMEHICKQLLDHSETYKVLLHNLPIREEKQTIGEIDFILKEAETEQLVHVELTYKFYIIDPEILEPIHQLIGPNKRDTFFTKMEKIKNAQFSLLHTPAGSKALAENNIYVADVQHQACYKAQLFEPFASKSKLLIPLNQNCVVGYWLRMTDLQNNAFKNHLFYIPYKSEWVIAPNSQAEWTSHDEAMLEINLRLFNQNAPMVWMKKSETEFEKFFVVWW